jgi:hypothetical protein
MIRHKLAVLVTILLTVTSSQAQSQRGMCKSADKDYSSGATMCECPSLTGEGGLVTGGNAKVISRRLECNDGKWVATEAKCIDLDYARGSASALDDHSKLQGMYCPRASVAEEVAKILESANSTQGVALAVQLCKRFNVPPGVCASLLQAISSAAK